MRAGTSHGSLLSMRGLDSLTAKHNSSNSSLNHSMTWSSPAKSPTVNNSKGNDGGMVKSASIAAVSYVPSRSRQISSKQVLYLLINYSD